MPSVGFETRRLDMTGMASATQVPTGRLDARAKDPLGLCRSVAEGNCVMGAEKGRRATSPRLSQSVALAGRLCCHQPDRSRRSFTLANPDIAHSLDWVSASKQFCSSSTPPRIAPACIRQVRRFQKGRDGRRWKGWVLPTRPVQHGEKRHPSPWHSALSMATRIRISPGKGIFSWQDEALPHRQEARRVTNTKLHDARSMALSFERSATHDGCPALLRCGGLGPLPDGYSCQSAPTLSRSSPSPSTSSINPRPLPG